MTAVDVALADVRAAVRARIGDAVLRQDDLQARHDASTDVYERLDLRAAMATYAAQARALAAVVADLDRIAADHGTVVHR